jgi:hypothetical protein
MKEQGSSKRFASELLAENIARSLWEYLRLKLDSDGDTRYAYPWLELEISWTQFHTVCGHEKVYYFAIMHDPVTIDGYRMSDEAEYAQVTVHLLKESKDAEWIAKVATCNNDIFICKQERFGHYSFQDRPRPC